MKRFGMVFLSLLTIVLLAGCGSSQEKEQKLICTINQNEEGMEAKQVISMNFKNDKLNHMTMEVTTKITDSEIQKNWEQFKEFMNEDNQEFDKDGIRLTVSSNDQNYEYTTSLDIDVENATEEALKEQGFEGLKDDKSTLEENKKEAEKDGAICEIK